MDSLIVLREVPAPVIGSCGEVRDCRVDALEADLDWLKVSGVSVLSIDPTKHPEDLAGVPAANRAWQAEGAKALPLFVLGGQVLSRAAMLSRSQLAHVISQPRRQHALDQVRQLAAVGAAAAMGADQDLATHLAHARRPDLDEAELEVAIAAGREVAQDHHTVGGSAP
jgi:hypothetical protein